jgi:WD40 repeat protein
MKIFLFVTAAALNAQTWTADIFPLLDKRCGACHGEQSKMGEFSVHSYASTVRGGNHGKTVAPGNPDESLLVQYVTGKAYPKMPMDGSTLSDGEVDLIRGWIKGGAKGPAEPEKPQASGPAPNIKPKGPLKPQIFAMAWQPQGSLLALAGYKAVTLLDAQTRKTVATLAGAADTVRNVAFSPDGKLVAAAGGLCGKKGEVKVWNAATRDLLTTISGHDDCVYGVAFSPDGKILATSSYDKLIKLWDVQSGKEVRTLKDHIDSVYTLTFTPDGRRLISGAADRTIKIWDPATGKRLFTLSEPTDGINTVAVDPSGKLVAAAGLDKNIRIWRLDENSGELLNSLMAHEDQILKLAWSPDGKTIASASADKTIKLFRAADLTEVKVLPNQTDWIYGLQFSPDGRQIAIARLDGSLAVVPVTETLAASQK